MTQRSFASAPVRAGHQPGPRVVARMRANEGHVVSGQAIGVAKATRIEARRRRPSRCCQPAPRPAARPRRRRVRPRWRCRRALACAIGRRPGTDGRTPLAAGRAAARRTPAEDAGHPRRHLAAPGSEALHRPHLPTSQFAGADREHATQAIAAPWCMFGERSTWQKDGEYSHRGTRALSGRLMAWRSADWAAEAHRCRGSKARAQRFFDRADSPTARRSGIDGKACAPKPRSPAWACTTACSRLSPFLATLLKPSCSPAVRPGHRRQPGARMKRDPAVEQDRRHRPACACNTRFAGREIDATVMPAVERIDGRIGTWPISCATRAEASRGRRRRHATGGKKPASTGIMGAMQSRPFPLPNQAQPVRRTARCGDPAGWHHAGHWRHRRRRPAAVPAAARVPGRVRTRTGRCRCAGRHRGRRRARCPQPRHRPRPCRPTPPSIAQPDAAPAPPPMRPAKTKRPLWARLGRIVDPWLKLDIEPGDPRPVQAIR